MKKLVSLVLISTLVLSSATFAFADPWKGEKGHGKFIPPGIAKKFMDIDGYEWAREAIERMVDKEVIKGIGEGLFAPQKEVTKLEAIVMALRVMGEEPTAKLYLEQIKIGKKSFKLKGEIQDWSYGYVKLAEEKGILEEYELIDLNLKQPAKRHEVAKYMLRAAGYKEEAEDHMDENLDFIDAPAMPVGSIGYVYLAEDMGLIKGYNDNSFRPNKPVTRAEMAVMIDRLDGKEIENEYETYKGEVTDIDTAGSSKSIEIDDEEVFKLKDDTKVVFENGVKGYIYDIKLDDEVKVRVNKDDTVISIQVDRKLEVDKYTGTIVGIEEDDDEYKFTIYTSKKSVEFTVDDDFEIEFKDEDGEIENLRIGDKVEIVLDDGEVEKIIVNRDIDAEFSNAIIVDIFQNQEQILIMNNNEYKTYFLDEDVKVYLNGDRVRLSKLKKDDQIRFRIEDKKIIEINAYRLVLE